MELHDLIRHEWHDDGILSRRSLIWIDEHADPGDPNPIITAINQLRSERFDVVGPPPQHLGREVQQDPVDAPALMLPEVAPAPIRLV